MLGCARIFTCPGLFVAVSVHWTVAVARTLRNCRTDTFATFRQSVAVIDWTYAASPLVYDHSSFQGTYAPSGLIYLQSIFFTADLTVFVNTQTVTWWTFAFTVGVAYETSIRWTKSHFVALNCCITLVTRQALTNHRTNRQRIQNLTHRVDAAWFCYVARVDTFSLDAGRLRWTFSVRSTPIVSLNASTDRICFEWWWTGTFRTVLIHLAQFVLGTNCLAFTRVVTFSVNTCLIQWTVRVSTAS